MKRLILCSTCFGEAGYTPQPYVGEHVTTVIGNLRNSCICDHCGGELHQTAAVACVSIWNDELESRGRGYHRWEDEYISPIDPLTSKILDRLSEPGKEKYGDHQGDFRASE